MEEMEQQLSDDEEKNTPLARRTRSARASKPSRFVLPLAIVPDESSMVASAGETDRDLGSLPVGLAGRQFPRNCLPYNIIEF